jgi:hypothetical protein
MDYSIFLMNDPIYLIEDDEGEPKIHAKPQSKRQSKRYNDDLQYDDDDFYSPEDSKPQEILKTSQNLDQPPIHQEELQQKIDQINREFQDNSDYQELENFDLEEASSKPSKFKKSEEMLSVKNSEFWEKNSPKNLPRCTEDSQVDFDVNEPLNFVQTQPSEKMLIIRTNLQSSDGQSNNDQWEQWCYQS